MTKISRIALWTVVGHAAANLVFQAFGAQEWGVALERSYFQACVIGSLLAAVWVEKRVGSATLDTQHK